MSGSVTWNQALSGTRAAATRVGDDMERIALRETGNAANWYLLVAANNLLPPYITDDEAQAGNGVLLAGQDTIKVPAPAPQASGVADPDDVYGKDVQLVGGQMAVSSSGDFAVVSGTDNLVQSVELRVGAYLGDLVYHPTYGNGAYLLLGKSNDGTTGSLLAVYVARCLASDPRIDSVPTLTVTTTGGTASVEGTAMAVDGKRLPVGTTLNGAA
jgi:hypothetical protein